MKLNFKKMYSLRAKVFMLAGFLTGMTACKDVNEPEMKSGTQQTISSHYIMNNENNESQDKFMKHLSDINNSKFYITPDAYFRPEIGVSGNVAGVYFKEYSEDNDNVNESLYWPSNSEEYMERIYNPTDTVALFKDNKWNFYVGGCFADPGEDWKIRNVPNSVYQNTFLNMSDSALALLAKNHLQSVNADPGHVQHIYQAIIDGYGVWSACGDSLGMSSLGAKIGLKHSDIGLCEGTEPVKGDSTKHEMFPYCGGVEHKRLNASSASTRFKGMAHVSVMPTEKSLHSPSYGGITGIGLQKFSTDSAGATFSHGSVSDTLLMPFNNWYTVKVIMNHNTKQIEFYAENYQSSLPENVWGLYNNTQNNVYTVSHSNLIPEIGFIQNKIQV